MAVEQIADDVITHAQRTGFEIAPYTYDQTADRGPPHPVHGERVEIIFGLVERQGQQRGQRTAQHPRNHARDECDRCNRLGVQGEKRTRLKHEVTQKTGYGAGKCHRQQAARTQFEQQELDSQKERRDRRGENGRHAGACAGDQQGLAFGGREMQVLREQRSPAPPCHDDRPLSPERAAAADDDSRRDRFEYGHSRRHPALAEQNGLHGFRNTVAPDLFAPVACHEAYQHPPYRRHQNNPHPQRIPRGRGIGQRQALVEKHVGKKMDQRQQRRGSERADDADE